MRLYTRSTYPAVVALRQARMRRALTRVEHADCALTRLMACYACIAGDLCCPVLGLYAIEPVRVQARRVWCDAHHACLDAYLTPRNRPHTAARLLTTSRTRLGYARRLASFAACYAAIVLTVRAHTLDATYPLAAADIRYQISCLKRGPQHALPRSH